MRIDTPKIVIHVEIVAIISTTSKHKLHVIGQIQQHELQQ